MSFEHVFELHGSIYTQTINKYCSTMWSTVDCIHGGRTEDMKGQLISYTWVFFCGVGVRHPLIHRCSTVNCMCNTCILKTGNADRNWRSLQKCKDMRYTWIRSFNSVKKSVLPKLVYICNRIPNKISKGFLVEITQQN